MKILYVTTISGTLNAFLVPHIKLLLDLGHKVDIACNVTNPINNDLIERGCRVFNLNFQRKPLRKQNYVAYKELQQIIEKEQYHVIHTHTPVASAITRSVCKNIPRIKVFYTAHGLHFYKGAPLKNWLIYYPLEKWLSKYTDTLITINHEDYELAHKKMKAKKIVYVPGVGFDLGKFGNPIVDRVSKREELGIPNDRILLLSVGELNKNKNHETIIRAIAGMDVYYIIAGRGDKKEYLEEVAAEVGMTDRVKLLGYRTDVNELYAVADLFVFPSFREGLPVSLMEAMASGLPCAVSKIRGNTDLLDQNGGVLFNPASIEECKSAIEQLLNINRTTMGEYNREKIKDFDIKIVVEQVKDIYI